MTVIAFAKVTAVLALIGFCVVQAQGDEAGNEPSQDDQRRIA